MHRQGLEGLLASRFNRDAEIYGIEIGCFKADLSCHLFSKFLNLQITTIDPYVQWSEVIEKTKEYSHRLQIIPLMSDVAHNLLSIKYDFIFIDGDHSYEQCKKDILNYQKLLKDGGLLAGHNYHKSPCRENGNSSADSAHPGVHHAVDEIFGDRVKLAPDFIWYV